MLVKIEYPVVVDDEFRRRLAFWIDTKGNEPSVLFVWEPRLASRKEIKEFYRKNGGTANDDVTTHYRDYADRAIRSHAEYSDETG